MFPRLPLGTGGIGPASHAECGPAPSAHVFSEGRVAVLLGLRPAGVQSVDWVWDGHWS